MRNPFYDSTWSSNMDYDYPEIARALADLIQRSIAPLLGTASARTVTGRSAGGGPTKYIDRVAEDTAITYLKCNDIESRLITEESGLVGEGDLTIILDPLDGTTNAVAGIPFYAVSLAFWGETKYGFVKNLCTHDIYEAFLNKSPLKNGETIYPGCSESVASGYSGKGFETVFSLVDAWRCFGSLSLELSYVAEGKLAALVDLRKKARVVDIAGAQIIAETAGIQVTDERGNSPFADGFFEQKGDFAGKNIICALPEFHEKILNALQEE
jgi:myo-inositol-1(or 4)-monophosphatase